MIVIKVIRTEGGVSSSYIKEIADDKKALKFLKDLAKTHQGKDVTKNRGVYVNPYTGNLNKRRSYTGKDILKVDITHEDDILY